MTTPAAAANDPTVSPAAFPAAVETATAARFAQQHFGQANLGHRARNACLRRVAERVCRHPGGTLPNKFGSPADYKAMDRLMNRPEVTYDRVLQAHLQGTRQQMETAHEVVLLLHDTTELDYSGLHSIDDLGPIGNGGRRGYLCHNTLAVLPRQRTVLGLAYQILHARQPVPKREKRKHKRQRLTRESRLWSRAVDALGAAPAGQEWVDVADRGADIFEFLATEERLRRACLVRACQNRKILPGHEGEGPAQKLFDYLRGMPAAGAPRSQQVYGPEQQTARAAQLAVSFVAVRLCPPRSRRGEYEPRPLAVWAVRVWEVAAASGGKPVEWLLLSNRPVTTVAQAWEKSVWYGYRPMVEE